MPRCPAGRSTQARDNMAARVKHADAPERFMDTEVDLDEAVRQLQAVASAPELYPDFVRLGAVPGVLALLSHENGDLAASVAELLRELTDADAVEDSARRQLTLPSHLLGGRSCSMVTVSTGLFGWRRRCLTMRSESSDREIAHRALLLPASVCAYGMPPHTATRPWLRRKRRRASWWRQW